MVISEYGTIKSSFNYPTCFHLQTLIRNYSLYHMMKISPTCKSKCTSCQNRIENLDMMSMFFFFIILWYYLLEYRVTDRFWWHHYRNGMFFKSLELLHDSTVNWSNFIVLKEHTGSILLQNPPNNCRHAHNMLHTTDLGDDIQGIDRKVMHMHIISHFEVKHCIFLFKTNIKMFWMYLLCRKKSNLQISRPK